eukprot:3688193-Prymnesium_polylepis.1
MTGEIFAPMTGDEVDGNTCVQEGGARGTSHGARGETRCPSTTCDLLPARCAQGGRGGGHGHIAACEHGDNLTLSCQKTLLYLKPNTVDRAKDTESHFTIPRACLEHLHRLASLHVEYRSGLRVRIISHAAAKLPN